MFSRKRFDHLDRQLEKLELYFTIRDPGTSMSAEAYDGLRRLLIKANKGTQTHMAQLAQLHRAAETADSLDPVVAKLGEFMQQMGVVSINELDTLGLDPSHPSLTEFFDVTDTAGDTLVIDVPAYVSVKEGKVDEVVSRGVAHFEGSPVGASSTRQETEREHARTEEVEETATPEPASSSDMSSERRKS